MVVGPNRLKLEIRKPATTFNLSEIAYSSERYAAFSSAYLLGISELVSDAVAVPVTLPGMNGK